MEPAKRELEVLLEEAVVLALEMLRHCGTFLPYGAGMDSGEAIQVFGAGDSESDMIEAVRARLQESAASGQFRMTALLYNADIAIEDGTRADAITIELDHVDHPPVIAFLSYVRSGGSVSFGKAFSEAGTHGLFDRLPKG